MIVLSLQHVQKAFGTNVVLKDINMVLQDNERMGLVGVNGCGKSTLLKVITGREHSDGGIISVGKDLRLGYLEQQNTVKPGNTVFGELEDVFAPVMAMEKRMREIEHEMASAGSEKELKKLGNEYDKLSVAFEKEDGYAWRSSILGVLAGLGFQKEQHEQQASLLSGGELTRLCLAKLLLQKPDILLLDEPTNHLDLEALDWLEKYLLSYKGAILIVSHDRYFMDKVCNRISELLFGTVEQYNGNYSQYMTQRVERFEARQKAYDIQQKEIEHQEAVIAKLRSFNREKSIKRAESRQKMLDKIERLDKPTDEREVRFRFETKRRTGDDVLMLKDLKKSFGERTLFEHLNLDVKSGERIALIGPNGIGKSTLFHCLTGLDHPDCGQIRWGTNVDIGYYDQHQRNLHDDKSVLDEVWGDFPRMLQYEVRGALGLFLFSGEDVFSPISTLSGGEKGRVALTKLMLRKDNVLLLDEPTNHLDMDSREVLEEALSDFEGTIIAISHDRYFINRFADHVVVLTQTGATVYQGNYDDYQAQIARPVTEFDMALASGKTRTEIGKEKRLAREEKEKKKAAEARVAQIEESIAQTEEKIAQTEQLMAQPETYSDPDKAAQTARAYQELKDALSRLYDEWEQAAQEASD